MKQRRHRLFVSIAPFLVATVAAANDTADLEARARALTAVSACFAPTFSPDGKQIAFLSDMTGTPQVWVVPTAGGWPTKLTSFNDPVGSVAWSPTGEWLAYSVSPGGGMNSQVFLMRPDGTGNKKIAGGGKAVTWMGLWQPDGKTITISSNQRQAVAIDAYLYDVPTGEMKRVTEDAMGMNAVVEFTPDHSKALVLRMLDQYQAHPFLLDLATGARTELTHHENPGIWRGGGLAGNDTVYMHSNLDRDFVAFARVKLDATGKPGPLEVIAARDDADLEHFELTPDRSAAALLWNVAGRSELELMDLRTTDRTLVPLPSEVADSLRFSPDGNLLAMVLGGSTVVPDIFVLDRRTGTLSQVTHSPHPGVDLATLVRPTLVRYRAHDGIDLSGWLYRPHGASGPGRVVLSFHGGPSAQETPALRTDYQALLSAGISVFAPNVRGSTGFGKRFENADNGALRHDAIKDIATSAQYLIDQRIAAPGRIGITGMSYGGYMTWAGIAFLPDLFSAAVAQFGLVNFETYFSHQVAWKAAILTTEYGDPRTSPEMMRGLSPLHRMDQVKAPVLILHGANDTGVPVVESEQAKAALEKNGKTVKFILVPDEGHGFQQLEHRVLSTVETVRWFEQYL
jgi:dipeptidyl aminopeptidase/acylaminoacyl peptidase